MIHLAIVAMNEEARAPMCVMAYRRQHSHYRPLVATLFIPSEDAPHASWNGAYTDLSLKVRVIKTRPMAGVTRAYVVVPNGDAARYLTVGNQRPIHMPPPAETGILGTAAFFLAPSRMATAKYRAASA